jgi:hypothetical protein
MDLPLGKGTLRVGPRTWALEGSEFEAYHCAGAEADWNLTAVSTESHGASGGEVRQVGFHGTVRGPLASPEDPLGRDLLVMPDDEGDEAVFEFLGLEAFVSPGNAVQGVEVIARVETVREGAILLTFEGDCTVYLLQGPEASDQPRIEPMGLRVLARVTEVRP